MYSALLLQTVEQMATGTAFLALYPKDLAGAENKAIFLARKKEKRTKQSHFVFFPSRNVKVILVSKMWGRDMQFCLRKKLELGSFVGKDKDVIKQQK